MKVLNTISRILFVAGLVSAVVFQFLIPVEPYSAKYEYQGIQYDIYIAHESDGVMIAGVRNGRRIKSKLLDLDDSYENGLITKSKSPFKRFAFDAEKIIEYVLN